MTGTVADLVRDRQHDDNPGLISGDQVWTWRQVVAESSARAAWLRDVLDPGKPPNVGVLLPNTADYVFLLLGAALGGACVVGANTSRSATELRRDLEHTECQLLLTDKTFADELSDLGRGVPTITVDAAPWAAFSNAVLPDTRPDASDLLLLIFTSGSTSAPKAVRRSQGRVAAGARLGFKAADVLYCPMPLSHGNALFSNLYPGVAGGSTIVLRDRFSATNWLPDIRQYRATFTNTVGRALGYVLATPPSPVDKDHALKIVLAPEASPRDAAVFSERFGVPVFAGYGSSESAIALLPSHKPGSLGKAPRGSDIAVVDPKTRLELPAAQFDESGRLLNSEEAIGELVRRDATGSFEGYWNNPEAEAERMQDGWFFSGDLAYRDLDGVFWFAGRTGDWLRVDSENFAAAPVERILARFPGVAAVAVVGVPDPQAGDQVLAALEFEPGATFDPVQWASFVDTQADLGTKWSPRFVRVCTSIPTTGNGKIDKRPVKQQAWLTDDPVWWRPARQPAFHLVDDADRAALAAQFQEHGRAEAQPTG